MFYGNKREYLRKWNRFCCCGWSMVWSIPISVGDVFCRRQEWRPCRSQIKINGNEVELSPAPLRCRKCAHAQWKTCHSEWFSFYFIEGKQDRVQLDTCTSRVFFFCPKHLSPRVSVSHLFSIFLKLFPAMNLPKWMVHKSRWFEWVNHNVFNRVCSSRPFSLPRHIRNQTENKRWRNLRQKSEQKTFVFRVCLPRSFSYFLPEGMYAELYWQQKKYE